MDLKEIGEFDRFPYKKKCTCGKEYIILTQEDDSAEYLTSVYLKCSFCDKYIEFILPVN